MKEIESKVTTEITPELAAKAFAHFDDHEQADFFEHLAEAVKTYDRPDVWPYGEMQWCYMHGRLKERGGDALKMYLAMSSFAFEFAQDAGMLRQKHHMEILNGN